MSLTKNDMAYRLFAITRSKVEGLDQETSDAVATEVDRFQAGKDSRLKTEELADLLDKVAAAVGPEIADLRVEHRKKVDALYTAGGKDVDYVKTFGREAVRAWLAENESQAKITTKTKAADLNKAVAEQKAADWLDEAPHVSERKRQEEIGEAQAQADRRAAAAAAPKADKTPSSKALRITEPVAIEVGAHGVTCRGLLHPDASVSFDVDCEGSKALAIAGKTFRSTSKAACAAMQAKSANGWLRITYLDGETRRPIDALRVNAKGWSLSGSGRRKKTMDPAAAKTEVTRLEARVRRLTSSLEKAQADLAAAKLVAEAKDSDGEAAGAPAEEIAEEPRTPGVDEQALAIDAAKTREDELRGMKAKQLREIAAELQISGRSKLKVDDLVSAIMEAEAA